MLFRNKDGNLIEINKLDFINDTEYNRAISECYGFLFNPKQHNILDTIISLSKKGVYNNSEQNHNTKRENITKDHNISNI